MEKYIIAFEENIIDGILEDKEYVEQTRKKSISLSLNGKI